LAAQRSRLAGAAMTASRLTPENAPAEDAMVASLGSPGQPPGLLRDTRRREQIGCMPTQKCDLGSQPQRPQVGLVSVGSDESGGACGADLTMEAADGLRVSGLGDRRQCSEG
jgi:hypothetical protein